MKNLYTLVISVFAILVIASCDSSTSPDGQEGQRIGTWMVYDTEADWLGTQSQSKAKIPTINAEGDTLNFDNPDGISLQMFQIEGGTIKLSYVDSIYWSDNSTHIWTNNPFADNHMIAGTYDEEGQRKTVVDIDVVCDSSYTNSSNLHFVYSDGEYNSEEDSAKVTQVVNISADGIVTAAKTLNGCS